MLGLDHLALVLGRVKKGREEMTASGFFARRRKSRKEPSYVRTAAYDGRKYVDLDEFMKDPEIRRQVKELAKESDRK